MLELKKLEMHLMKARAAKSELEYKIAEHEDNIARMREHIALQEKRENEILEEIKKLKGE